MTKLYELAAQYKQFHTYVEDALGAEDLTEDDLQMFLDTLDSIQDSVEGKVENIVKFLKSIEGDIKTFKEEEKRLAQKRKYLENKFDGLKTYTQSVLEINGFEKVKAGTFSVRLQKNPPSVFITNENLIPAQYRIAQPDKIANKDILEDLKNGVIVEGAVIADEKKHIRIS